MKPVNHVKKAAKRIKRKYPYISLMKVQHDLAQYLGFKKWPELLAADEILLQKRIKEKPLRDLA